MLIDHVETAETTETFVYKCRIRNVRIMAINPNEKTRSKAPSFLFYKKRRYIMPEELNAVNAAQEQVVDAQPPKLMMAQQPPPPNPQRLRRKGSSRSPPPLHSLGKQTSNSPKSARTPKLWPKRKPISGSMQKIDAFYKKRLCRAGEPLHGSAD
jgi:hypothetical protein